MTKFELFVTFLVAIGMVMEIIICFYMVKMFADIEAMRYEYLDLLKDACTDGKNCFDQWGAAMDGWRKALDEWENAIQIFNDYCGCPDGEGQTKEGEQE